MHLFFKSRMAYCSSYHQPVYIYITVLRPTCIIVSNITVPINIHKAYLCSMAAFVRKLLITTAPVYTYLTTAGGVAKLLTASRSSLCMSPGKRYLQSGGPPPQPKNATVTTVTTEAALRSS